MPPTYSFANIQEAASEPDVERENTMALVVQFAIFAAHLMGVLILTKHHSVRGSLTDRRFAAIFACGFSLMIGLIFFSGLVMSRVAISPWLARLGLGMVLINAAAAYPVAYLGHKYLLRKAIARLSRGSRHH